MDDVAKYPGLMRRSARWYLRARVPVDLVSFLGRAEVWQSLKPGDHREAVRRYTSARAELQRWLDQQRRRRDAGEKINGEAPRLVASWFHEHERRGAHLDFELVGDLLHEAQAEAEQTMFDLLNGASGEDVAAAVEQVLIANGWPARPHVVGSISTRKTKVADAPAEHRAALADLARRALIEAARRRLDRLHGIPVRPVDPLFAGSLPVQPGANGEDRADGITLGELIKRFEDERGPAVREKTRVDYRMLWRVLREVWHDHRPAREITRDACREVRDLFAALPSNADKRFPGKPLAKVAEHARRHNIAPMRVTTANKHIRRLSSFLGWAAREEYIPRNPAVGLAIAAPEDDPRDGRRPLTPEQIIKIFDAPLYRGCLDDGPGYATPGPNIVRRGRFWVPLLCLFGGLRMGEACQLGVRDVAEQGGIPVILVRPDPEAGTRLKTRSSRRVVPIHPELARLGFLEFAARQREAGHDRLFPELKRDRRGSYSGHFQRWANRFLETAGAKGERQSFHSTRHSSPTPSGGPARSARRSTPFAAGARAGCASATARASGSACSPT